MSIIKQVSKDLPNFPDDVINQWIGYYAESEGWPPPAPLEGRWKGLLANRDLEYWSSLRWSKEALYPPSLVLTPNCNRLIQEMIGFHEAGVPCPYSEFMGEEAKLKLAKLLQYLRESGNLPCSPILIEKRGEHEIIDGNHRVVAYLLWGYWKDKEVFQKEPFPVPLNQAIEFWVGREDA
ncbi:hypothetical protein [Isoalcanivorax indicus]|uniref:hypothetical protein n=1 Tax=Isoalcanivorax indicus TaxID=2202653 RepID=UPI0013C45E94|nr:hypothetical protein [Isoalcanivorax indicus]